MVQVNPSAPKNVKKKYTKKHHTHVIETQEKQSQLLSSSAPQLLSGLDHQHHHVLRRGGAGGAEAQRLARGHGHVERGQHEAGRGQGTGADLGDEPGSVESWAVFQVPKDPCMEYLPTLGLF